MFGLFKKKSEIKLLIEKRFEDLQQNKTMFCEYASMFAASAIELSKNNSSLSAVTYQDQSLRCLGIYQFSSAPQSCGRGRQDRINLTMRRSPRVNQEVLPRATFLG
jgi:hypothetical protein